MVVPAGLGARAARRVLVWRVWHDNNVLFALGAGALVWALGQPELATTLVVAQTGSLVAAAAADRRVFDRTYPASIPVEAQWRGRILELRSTQGQWTVDLDPVTSATRAGDLVVVRRRGMPPLVLPDVLVGDDAPRGVCSDRIRARLSCLNVQVRAGIHGPDPDVTHAACES